MTAKAIATFRAHLRMVSTKDGGRVGPIAESYRPMLRIASIVSECSVARLDVPMLQPGAQGEAEIRLLDPDRFDEYLARGKEFDLLEATKKVASGVIISEIEVM